MSTFQHDKAVLVAYCCAALYFESSGHIEYSSTTIFATTIRASVEFVENHRGKRVLAESPVLLRSEGLNIALATVNGNQLLRCFHVYVGMSAFVEELTFAPDTALGNSWSNDRQKSKSAPCCAACKMNANY